MPYAVKVPSGAVSLFSPQLFADLLPHGVLRGRIIHAENAAVREMLAVVVYKIVASLADAAFRIFYTFLGRAALFSLFSVKDGAFRPAALTEKSFGIRYADRDLLPDVYKRQPQFRRELPDRQW